MSGNSSDRRRDRRSKARSNRGSKISWCLAVAVAIVIWFLPNRDKTLTVIGLVVLGCLVLYPLLGLTYLRDAAGLTRFVRFVLVVGVISVVMVVFGIVVWPPMSLGKLSSSEADAFIKELNTQSVPIIVNLMCPPNDERDCTVGAQFIDLFRRARWTVRDNIVHRVFNGHPKAGLYFVLRSTVDPDPAAIRQGPKKNLPSRGQYFWPGPPCE